MLRQRIVVPDFAEATAGLESEIAGFLTAAMRDTTDEVKEAFRDQVRAANLGDRLANAVRGVTYPRRGNALEPAGWIYAQPSKAGRGAAAIIESYATGATIVPRAGRRWLLVPTDDTPRHRSGDAYSLAEVEARFGRLDWIPAKVRFATPSARGRASFYLAAKGAVIRKSTGRWRRASVRELSGKTRNPRPVQTVIMFNAVRAVKKPKSVDLSVPAALAERRFSENLTNRWR
jgi:hypothetical protein